MKPNKEGRRKQIAKTIPARVIHCENYQERRTAGCCGCSGCAMLLIIGAIILTLLMVAA
jgi:hypothetical protein